MHWSHMTVSQTPAALDVCHFSTVLLLLSLRRPMRILILPSHDDWILNINVIRDLHENCKMIIQNNAKILCVNNAAFTHYNDQAMFAPI